MAGPIDPRLLRRARATRGYLVAGVAVGCATAILALGQAWLLSRSISDIFATHRLDTLAVAVAGLVVVFTARAGLAWLNAWLAHRTAAAVKSQLRLDIMRARLGRPIDSSGSSASLITLVTQGLDALDGYFSKYLPQLLLAVTVPVIIGIAIGSADLISLLVIVITMPLIPVFMVLIGWTTQARTRKRWRVQTRLANHFADLVLGLPTLQVFGRAKAQAEGLKRTEAAHRSETMATLRISFLSALALELLATLSVAVVAVTVGLRVVDGSLDLATALFVLILAPEAYLPVRQVGVHYHDAADGMAAAQAAFAQIEAADSVAVGHHTPPAAGTVAVSLNGIEHTYPGVELPAVSGLSFTVEPGRIVALTGASGAGKSTALNAVMGFLTPTKGSVLVGEHDLASLDQRAWRSQIAYVGQDPGMLNGTVADNVRLGFADATDVQVRTALDRAGASGIELTHSVGDDGEGLSAGERRRVAMARALLRVELGGARLFVLDEPTAGLDSDTEGVLLAGLKAAGVAGLVVSHRPAVIAQADQVVAVTGAGMLA